ncbi:MAG: glutamine--fructose-6-phosphate transaminase (isomerizing) [Candidatus Odinarchaeota archaeon]|nr:glutamine--fructose-6-phosphate transaminase (isomerizing) [Candidatus Odinarchaeota archaeon]
MCGIIGIVSNDRHVASLLRECLKRLEYRGYDSVGITTIYNSTLHTKKDKGKIDEIHQKLNFDTLPGHIGIGHTRWATHGPPSKRNAHPHMDCTRKIAVVHNGIIENFLELRKQLEEKGHVFQSDTDTEVIPHLIEEYIATGYNLADAVREALKQLKGSYAIAVIYAEEPDKIVCARKDSPLVIGIGEKAVYCASDIPAFLPMTNKVIFLNDGELAILTPYSVTVQNLEGEVLTKEIKIINWTAEMAQKGGFPHFVLKEIHEQPRAIRDTLRTRQEYVDVFVESIMKAKRIYFVAAGTSYHAGLTATYMFSKLAKTYSQAVIASEFPEFIGETLDEDTVIVAITQSGETADTLTAVRHATKYGAKILAITNVLGSSITRHAHHTFYMQAGPEIGVVATKTFTTQLATLALITINLARQNGALTDMEAKQLFEELYQIPAKVKEIIETHEERAKTLAEKCYLKNNFYFLGRGISTATALEGALKLKEISYIHAEGYPAGESKHGPIALIEPGYPCVFIAPMDETHKHIIGNIMEMKARGAEIIAVIDKSDQDVLQLADTAFKMPSTPAIFTPITYIIPLQLFAYYVAVKRGVDPDKPRNLAKSVTVV